MKQKQVTLYTFTRCPYCIKAKRLLSAENIFFQEIVVTNTELKELEKNTKMKTVPQIFVDETLIGGFDDLQKLHQNNRLFKDTFFI